MKNKFWIHSFVKLRVQDPENNTQGKIIVFKNQKNFIKKINLKKQMQEYKENIKECKKNQPTKSQCLFQYHKQLQPRL